MTGIVTGGMACGMARFDTLDRRCHKLLIGDIVGVDRQRRFVLVGILIPVVQRVASAAVMVPVPPAAERIVGIPLSARECPHARRRRILKGAPDAVEIEGFRGTHIAVPCLLLDIRHDRVEQRLNSDSPNRPSSRAALISICSYIPGPVSLTGGGEITWTTRGSRDWTDTYCFVASWESMVDRTRLYGTPRKIPLRQDQGLCIPCPAHDR